MLTPSTTDSVSSLRALEHVLREELPNSFVWRGGRIVWMNMTFVLVLQRFWTIAENCVRPELFGAVLRKR